MIKVEYGNKGNCLQRENVKCEEYVEMCNTENREVN